MRKTCLAMMALAGLGGPALAAEPTGDWMVKDKTAVVRVAPCGQAVCGHIIWTKMKAGTDTNNPDPAKRSRPIIGMPIFSMKPTAANRWEGEIYNAEDGKTYSGNLAVVSDGVLSVGGCVLGFLCLSQDWTRAKCDQPAGGGAGRAPAMPTSCREAAP